MTSGCRPIIAVVLAFLIWPGTQTASGESDLATECTFEKQALEPLQVTASFKPSNLNDSSAHRVAFGVLATASHDAQLSRRAMLVEVRNYTKVIALFAAAPSTQRAAPSAETRLAEFLGVLAANWEKAPVSSRERAWAPIALTMRKNIRPQPELDENTPIGVQFVRDANGVLSRDLGGTPRFTLGIYPPFIDRLLNSPDSLSKHVLASFLVKEIGTAQEAVRHPFSSQADVLLSRELNRLLAPYAGHAVPFAALRHTKAAEVIKTLAAISLRPEAVGYAAQVIYAESVGLNPRDLLSHARLLDFALSSNYRYLARMIQSLSSTDREWRAAQRHLRGILGSSEISWQREIFSLALRVEAAEGRAMEVQGRAVVPAEPGTEFPRATFMGYLRDPSYYAPTPAILRRRFGIVATGRLRWNVPLFGLFGALEKFQIPSSHAASRRLGSAA